MDLLEKHAVFSHKPISGTHKQITRTKKMYYSFSLEQDRFIMVQNTATFERSHYEKSSV